MSFWCQLGFHSLIKVKTCTYLDYMGLAMGELLQSMTTRDLFILMEQIDALVPTSHKVRHPLDSEIGSPLFNPQQPHLKEHLKILEKIQIDLSTLLRKSYRLRSSEEDREVESLSTTMRAPMSSFQILFCTSCKKTIDPRDELDKIIPKICEGLRAIKINEDSGKFAI